MTLPFKLNFLNLGRRILRIICLLSFIPFALAVLLFFVAETAAGRTAAGLLILCFTLFYGTSALVLINRLWRAKISGTLLLVLAIGSAMFFYRQSPPGFSALDSPFQSRYLNSVSYSRLSLANIVPEIDQLKLGTFLLPVFDPFIDWAQSNRIRRLFMRIYRPMREDPNFNAVGSVMNLSYRDLFLGRRPIGHYYEYVPPWSDDAPQPVIIFLHGSLGNFKGYMWLWKSLADQSGVAVVAPTFGAGTWQSDLGRQAIRSTLQNVKSKPQFQKSPVFIAGLSNGGLGASYAAAEFPCGEISGIIFLSPVLDEDYLLRQNFVNRCPQRPILFIHGEADRRIPLGYIQYHVQRLKKAGANIESHYYPEEDHFLVFSSWEQCVIDLKSWLNRMGAQN